MGAMETNNSDKPAVKFDSDAAAEEPKDRTKWIWLGVVGLVIAMVALLWVLGRPDPKISMARARHILVQFDKSDPADRNRALNLCTDLRERLLRGERFETLAREFSNDPGSSRRGGDLGYYPKGTFAAEFEKYVWTAPEGQLSDIVETSHGFHLIIVVDRHLTAADRYDMELDERARQELDKRGEPAPPKP